MADITYQLNFTGKQINNLLTRTNNLDTELNNYLLKTGGDITGEINMNGQPISGLINPTEDTQAARKKYVDTSISTAVEEVVKNSIKSVCSVKPGNDGNVVLTAAKVGAVPASDLLSKTYPVGAIYISTSSTSPASLFGGTWERLKDRFLLAAGDSYTAGSTGGEATHTLTLAEMPSHDHQQYVGALDGSWGVRSDYQADGNFAGFPQGRTGGAGGSQPHNNMPPYLAVYMWKRVA